MTECKTTGCPPVNNREPKAPEQETKNGFSISIQLRKAFITSKRILNTDLHHDGGFGGALRLAWHFGNFKHASFGVVALAGVTHTTWCGDQVGGRTWGGHERICDEARHFDAHAGLELKLPFIGGVGLKGSGGYGAAWMARVTHGFVGSAALYWEPSGPGLFVEAGATWRPGFIVTKAEGLYIGEAFMGVGYQF
jgi:hypothetical protein